MHAQRFPLVSTWYTNLTGQLFKVRMILYRGDKLSLIAIEYLDGNREIITRNDWECLKLMKHSTERSQSVFRQTEEYTF